MPFKDLTNIRFGYLIAIKYIKSRDGNGAIWECLCDCGTICEVRSHSLLRNKTKSCGCKRGELLSKALSKEVGESNITQLYNTYKNQAKTRGYSWDISRDVFAELIKLDCFYCGIKPTSVLIKTNISGDRVLFYNGLDRKDNNKGYEIDNIVVACGTCNIAKKDSSFDDFIKWIRRVSKHLSERKII